ncbi:MAG TPA: LysM peptidoglycan-binding domain-containing protein, partial [Gemmatimonadales bacterium]|nr:LysM peptidoglycan-binding domain-containing protein [Gemmatimonadales bacterium]
VFGRTLQRSVLALTVFLTAGLPTCLLAQEAKPKTHTVKKGDTLWDIAGAYLRDPFQWPRIYRLNTDVVEDPHWIYPGEVLRLEGDTTVTAVPSQETPAPAQPADTAAQPADTAGAQAADTAAAPAEAYGAADTTDGYGMELFRRRRVANLENAFKLYRDVKPPLLREQDFHASGFLSEEEALPYGSLLGAVTPEQIETIRARAALQLFTRVGLRAPEGGSYAPGDSLLVVARRVAPPGYGEIVVPTGMIKVTGQNGDQMVGEIIQVWGTIRDGQSLLPAEKFRTPGPVEYQPVAEGTEGRILLPRDPAELRHPDQVLFLDIGKNVGVQPGDLFEARRDPGPQWASAADAVDELMATLQVVHVRERTATVRVMGVISPAIRPGTRVKQVARLPL